MLGMVDIITVVMEKEEIKKFNIKEEFLSIFKDYKRFSKFLLIVMVALIAIIAIILFSAGRNDKTNSIVNSPNDINVVEETDEKILELVNDYFNSKTNLNFAILFNTFGRDYYKEERIKPNEELKKIINNIRYERIFVERYENIKVYAAEGLHNDEKVLIVTYDMVMGFSDTTAPMILMFYIVDKNGQKVIKDSLDVGTSKYLVAVSNNDFVKELYKDVEARLEHATASSESLKLVYNSLRQIEVNQNFDLDDIDKKALIDELLVGKVDLLRDAQKIYDEIKEQNEEREAKEKLDNYINSIIASWSDTLVRKAEYEAEKEAALIEAIERRKALGLPY